MTSPNPKPKHPWVFDTETPITPDELDQIGDLGSEEDDSHDYRHERMPDFNDRQRKKEQDQQQEEKRHEGSQHIKGQ